VRSNVPVEVAGLGARDAERERCLSDLAWSGEEDHLAAQIFFDLRG